MYRAIDHIFRMTNSRKFKPLRNCLGLALLGVTALGCGDGGSETADRTGVSSSAASIDGGDGPAALDCSAALPIHLGCTGLYADWGTRALSPTVRAYDPALHLWSDGAAKRRFIELPQGSTIDTSDMDEWSFPV